MAESPTVRTKRDGTIVISAAPAVYTVAVEPGDFKYASPGYSTIRPLDRTEHATPRRGDAQVTTGGFSAHLRDIGSMTDYTLPDICERRVGSKWVADAVSTLDGISDEFTEDLSYAIDGSFLGEADKTLTFSDASLRGSFSEGDPDQYAVTFEASILAPELS